MSSLHVLYILAKPVIKFPDMSMQEVSLAYVCLRFVCYYFKFSLLSWFTFLFVSPSFGFVNHFFTFLGKYKLYFWTKHLCALYCFTTWSPTESIYACWMSTSSQQLNHILLFIIIMSPKHAEHLTFAFTHFWPNKWKKALNFLWLY